MKLKQYALVVALVLLSRLVPLNMDAARGFPNPFYTLAHAQENGYVGKTNMHSAKLLADFTDANASGLQNIPALQWTLPAGNALTFGISCDIGFSQATQVADSFGIQFSVAPTNSLIGGYMNTAATAFAAIAPATITGTSATNVVTGTPGGSGVLSAHIGGYVENPSGSVDNTVNISVVQSTAANVIVVKRDSGCTWWAMP